MNRSPTRKIALAFALLACAGLPKPVLATTYFCCQYDVPKCDGVQDPPDMNLAASACKANHGSPKPNFACVGKYCGVPPGTFKPSGTYDNPDTKAGVVTETTRHGALSRENKASNGVELVYHVAATTSECTRIATIQVVWYTDAGGQVRHQTEAPNPVPNASDLDKCDADGGYVVDFTFQEKTPYAQDNGLGQVTGPGLGTSDGNGNGAPAHTTDAPNRLKDGWTKNFEDWTVCIAGHNVGEVLGGVTWHVGPDGKAAFDDRKPAEPSEHFKDAVHAFEQAHPAFQEPGGGFQW